MISVYHLQSGNRIHIADIDTDSLETAYRLTQNIDGSWSQGMLFDDGEINNDYNSSIKVIQPLRIDAQGRKWGHRSTSIFDEMVHNGKTYVVGIIGFSLKEDSKLKIKPIFA